MYASVAQVNALLAANHLTLLVNRDPKKSKPKPPESFPTPDDDVRSAAPKQGSFAAMVVQAKRAARLRKEALNG